MKLTKEHADRLVREITNLPSNHLSYNDAMQIVEIIRSVEVVDKIEHLCIICGKKCKDIHEWLHHPHHEGD